MSEDLRLIDELAGAVMDGAPVDWTALEPGQPLVAHLRIAAAIAGVHRATALPSAPDAGDNISIGGTWGHLRILEQLGHGAFGRVYRAWDSRLDREVALKLIPATAAQASDDLRTSIIEEGRLLARVHHPNVVTIHGAEQIGDRIGLWMEFVRGRTLDAALKASRGFAPADVARVGIELTRAVSAVHAAGLLHRDIKAQNVMQADDGRIVLMDFGAGRELDTAAADIAGTPVYLAPEVFRGKAASIQSDIYSLGVLLYHLLTGSFPVRGRTVADVRQAHARDERESLRAERPDIPSGLARIIERAIDPAPERRYSSANALLTDLEALVRRSHWRWIGYAAVLLLALAVAFVAFDSRQTPRDGRRSQSVLPSGEMPAIAVLPFRNLSPDAGSSLIVDGLTSEIIRRLAAIEGLSIRSAAASFGLQDQGESIRSAGGKLNANLVLTGSVLTSNGQVRVTAELARVADLVTVWRDTFTLAGGDVLKAHDDVSIAIVNRLRLKVGPGPRRYDVDYPDYYVFLTGKGLMARRHTENAARAAAAFEQVIEKNPSFAPAWAGLASALAAFSMATLGEAMPPKNPRMDEAAIKAMDLDPLLAEAQSAMGSLYARDREWVAAEKHFRNALERDPSVTSTYTDFVLAVLQPMGRHEEAIQLLEEAGRVDPLSLDVRRVLALEQVDAGRYDEALLNAQWVLDRDPDFPYADLWKARALVFLGRGDEAEPIYKRVDDRFGYLGYLYATTGRRQQAEALANAHPEMPARQMLIYGGLGDRDRAFAALERAVAAHWWRGAAWMHRPEMALLHGDPRLAAIKRRLGLPD